jgi:peptide deformylase
MKKTKEALRIVHYGAPSLRRAAAKIGKVTPALKALAKEMDALMRAVHGVGLAATQVGIEQQIAVIDVGEGPIVLVNPRIVKSEGEEVLVEGCLSLPGLYGEVTRAAKVTVAATDLSGKSIKIEGEGMLARALQHEIDHLRGKLFIDRVDESSLHWLIRPKKAAEVGGEEEPEALCQPTSLQDALKVFLARQTNK